MKHPFDAVIAVTYRCNARCLMCNIWQSENSDQLDPALVEKLPPSLRYINLSGGEPFLHPGLNDIVAAVKRRCPSAQTIISTNALFKTDRMLEMVSAARALDPDIGLAVSIDGIGPVHDRIRGVDGAYDKCVALVETLKRDGMSNLRIAFTVVDENVEDFYRVYELSLRLGVEFTCALAQDSSHYFQTEGSDRHVDLVSLRSELNKIVTAELESASPKRWARAFFSRGLYEFAAGEGRPLSCHAAQDFIFVSPDGSIYPCNIIDKPLGNLKEASFDEIWNSTEAASIRDDVGRCELDCWMVCTARSAMKQHPVRVAGWISANKLKAMLGRQVLK